MSQGRKSNNPKPDSLVRVRLLSKMGHCSKWLLKILRLLVLGVCLVSSASIEYKEGLGRRGGRRLYVGTRVL